MEYLKVLDRGLPNTSTRPVKPLLSFRSARISNKDDLPHPDGPGINVQIDLEEINIYLPKIAFMPDENPPETLQRICFLGCDLQQVNILRFFI
jgi:hypothetical protein